jgi:glycogen(starch) synthase
MAGKRKSSPTGVTKTPLQLVVLSRPFHPMIGGLETAALLLARELSAQGHTVTVMTCAESEDKDTEPFQILRNPGAVKLFRAIQAADGIITQGLVLTLAWPLLFKSKPTVTIHQGMYPRSNRASWFRAVLAKRVRHIAISKSVASTIPFPSVNLGNPYQSNLFFDQKQPRAEGSMLFVGRLVPEKGPMDAIEALSLVLAENPHSPLTLTLVGEGPLLTELKALMGSRGLEKHVRWLGAVTGQALADLYNSHRIALVPSRWPEPLGIVALEAAACGCFVIGTEQGGLPEAIGPCGCVVPNHDIPALANAMREASSPRPPSEPLLLKQKNHLERFQPRHIAESIVSLFHTMLPSS